MVTRRCRRAAQGGFTLLEVLMALLIGMIGLLGTVAIQQTMFRATKNSSDGAIAMRLASQKMEEFAAAQTNQGPPILDELGPQSGAVGTWNLDFVNASGTRNTPPTTETPEFRWKREWQVVNGGANLPYKITVKISYDLDTGVTKFVQLDAVRRKTW